MAANNWLLGRTSAGLVGRERQVCHACLQVGLRVQLLARAGTHSRDQCHHPFNHSTTAMSFSGTGCACFVRNAPTCHWHSWLSRCYAWHNTRGQGAQCSIARPESLQHGAMLRNPQSRRPHVHTARKGSPVLKPTSRRPSLSQAWRATRPRLSGKRSSKGAGAASGSPPSPASSCEAAQWSALSRPCYVTEAIGTLGIIGMTLVIVCRSAILPEHAPW